MVLPSPSSISVLYLWVGSCCYKLLPIIFCSVEKQFLKVPRTITCHVLSSDTLAAVTLGACKDDNGEHLRETKACTEKSPQIQEPTQSSPPLILAGLHACGDLSVNMLRLVFTKYENSVIVWSFLQTC